MIQIRPFSITRLPRIEFGSGKFNSIASIVAGYGQNVLLVTGFKSFVKTKYWPLLQTQFKQHNLSFERVSINGEPSPKIIDSAVSKYTNSCIDSVISIGGGSALDAGKAIAGLLRVKRSVMDYLEGVGPELTYLGPAVPFIAVPTTAGTGSESTKNAVLSKPGKCGFKKSFRHNKLVAEIALVDPDLLSSCPQNIIAANGMDALTQLIESYVSLKANALNDALCVSGLRAVRDGLLPLYRSNGQNQLAREKMAYAAMISGINLAQTGLGSVHGLASPLGAYYLIPHGVVCGTLVAVATKINIQTMRQREPDNQALLRYAQIGEILTNKQYSSNQDAWEALLKILYQWTTELNLARLSGFGININDLDLLIANSRGNSMQTNPIVLEDTDLKTILLERL